MKKHKFSHTHVEHHNDGSHTVHHVHESGDPKKDIKAGVSDHDGLMDHMMEHTSAPGADEMAATAPSAAAIPPSAQGA